jgi:uncharacterized protein YqhQ
LGKRFHYGGQAVIEGVMMRGRGNVAVAVRRPNGEIALRREPLAALFSGRIRELPFVRGPIVLLETLILGVRSLYYSASVALEDEEESLSPVALWGIVALGFIIALVLFVALPLVISRFVVEPNIEGDMRAIVGNVADGFIRLVIFMVYLRAMNLLPDLRRVWAYHGAEHKTINAYEAGEDLEVDRVRPYGTAHTRCGTGFILIVLMIAILAHAFLGDPALWIRFLERLAILPLIGALSYELIKYSADHTRNRLVKIALVPGMALQSMTTREPEDDQIEVAISALKSVLADDVKSVGEPAEETAPVTGMTGGTGGVDL